MKEYLCLLFLLAGLGDSTGLSTRARDCSVCDGCCDTGTVRPVCDAQGRQFVNECYAVHCAKVPIKCHTACPCQKPCTHCRDSSPKVCGQNNQTYTKCIADCNSFAVDCEHECPCWG